MKRRGFLAALIAAPFMPKAVLGAVEKLAASRATFSGAARSVLGVPISDIIAATIESRSKIIADNIHKNNALLMMLRDPEYMRPEKVCRRRIEMRRSFPVRTRYAEWRDRMAA